MGDRSRRRGKGTRKSSPLILIALQGTETEKQYFQGYKQRLRAPNVHFCTPEALDPEKLVKKAMVEAKRREAEETYVVIDVDDSPSGQLQRAARLCASSGDKYPVHLVVSNPCFEIWLWWHYRGGPNGEADRNDLSRFLVGESALEGDPPKHLSSKFESDNEPEARKRANISELNEIGGNPSTSVPYLLDRIRRAARTNPQFGQRVPRRSP
ncbi:RloB family protein [Corynebacterium glutamicum]|uniref:RloB family protein n=1 Tax=Corynebacterium glutamicum TaxID=1718 RepID=UPI00058A6354|nr:hypothetical protein SB89_10410 [Corynebacterium glutamicum]OKX96162.1 hypothetical protein AUP72_00295 [Corynebacterium glutamicum]TWS37418.1 hypothetical protein AKJ21_07305 [Corynebacterium glutamicum]